jgi:hypothetical protein
LLDPPVAFGGWVWNLVPVLNQFPSVGLPRPPEKLANQVRKHREPGSSVGKGLIGELFENLYELSPRPGHAG